MNTLTPALIAMRRSPYQTLSAILLMTITFFVGYTFSLFSIGSELVLRHFETQPQVIAFFELDTPASSIATAAASLEQRPYVEGVTIISREEALKLYQQDNAQDPLLLELVTADILPASVEVRGKTVADLVTIKDELEKIEGVDDVVYQQELVESLSSWTRSLRWLGIGSLSVLGVTSFLIITVIIGMKVATKRPAITIMRIIGATRWYIRAPFLTEGVLYGLIGSFLGWGSMYVGLLYLTPWLKAFLGPIRILPVSPMVLLAQLGVGTLIALILGGLAATMAVSRLIKR